MELHTTDLERSSRRAHARAAPKARITRIPSTRADDRVAVGNGIRNEIPHEAHGAWTADPDRPHPIDLLTGDGTDPTDSNPAWFEAMMASPLAYYERSLRVMAYDLADSPVTGVQVQLCGDCHAANFGLHLSPDRRMIFDLREFGEMLPGPWEWDVKRLATGFILAGSTNDLSAAATREITRLFLLSYRQHMIQFAAMRTLDVWNTQPPGADALPGGSWANVPKRNPKKDRKRRSRRSLEALYTQVQIVDGARRMATSPPIITRPESRATGDGVHQWFQRYKLSLAGGQSFLLDQYRLVDAVCVMSDQDSQPAETFIWLLEGKDVMDTVFLQVREAKPPVLGLYLGTGNTSSPGERVVAGQTWTLGASDPYLGWFRSERGGDFYVQDAQAAQGRAQIDGMSASELDQHAASCGWALARLHARSGDRVQIAAYLGDGKSFDRALTDFAETYADQVQRDYRDLLKLRRGRKVRGGAPGSSPTEKTAIPAS